MRHFHGSAEGRISLRLKRESRIGGNLDPFLCELHTAVEAICKGNTAKRAKGFIDRERYTSRLIPRPLFDLHHGVAIVSKLFKNLFSIGAERRRR